MNNNTYTLQTPDHSYDFVPDPLVPNLVMVKSEDRESIEDFISTIELAGPEADIDFSSLTIEEDINDYDAYFYVEISRATLSLFLDFEVRYYLGASTNGN